MGKRLPPIFGIQQDGRSAELRALRRAFARSGERIAFGAPVQAHRWYRPDRHLSTARFPTAG